MERTAKERALQKWLVWFLTMAMVLTGVTVPGKTSEATADGDAGEVVEGITAEVVKRSGNADWAEYGYTIYNSTQEAAEGLQIMLPYYGEINTLKSWGCTVRKSEGYLIISHSAVLEAGASYTCNSDTKFGFAGGASFGSPVVVRGGQGTSSSQLRYTLTGQTRELAFADTPVGKHGQLRLQQIDGYSAPVIVDKNGKPYQLRGASTHGMHWNEMHPYVNKSSFQSLRDEWGVNLVRLVSYITQGGYTEGSQELLDAKIQEGVQAATELGMYVIIDWHVHAENPHTKKDWAETFFRKYATLYRDYDNVIFEICNEPTGVEWYNGSGSDLYSYCKEIAGVIRDCGSNALIVCGTNTWSQDVDDVAKKPLKEDGLENILYTFHFYSGSHYDDKMNKVRTAVAAGTPVFVTEFGICDASGNGNFDTENADAWIALCDEYNISFACWSLCNKNESASYLNPFCSKTTGGWVESDLATTGIWLVNTYRAHQELEEGNDDPTGGGSTGGGDSTGGSGSTGGEDSTGGGSSIDGGSPDGSGQTGLPVSTALPNTPGAQTAQQPGGSAGGGASNDAGGSTSNDAVRVSRVRLQKVTAGRKSLTVRWKKGKNADGYQVTVSRKKNFAGSRKILVKAGRKSKITVKKLASRQKYYIRIRAWRKVGGEKAYGVWSKTRVKKTK